MIHKLSNGLTLLTHNMPNAESVTINVLVKLGSRYEEECENGICHFLEHMAFKGTHKYGYKEIAEIFDSIGGSFNAYTSKEHTVYYAKVLKEDWEQALEILYDIIMNSVYPQQEIDKEKMVIFQEIARNEDSPEDIVYDNLIKSVYKDQPLGRCILGTREKISQFTRQDFINYVKRYHTAHNIIVSVAGKIHEAELLNKCEGYFGNIDKGNQSHFKPAKYYKSNIAQKKDLQQTHIAIAYKSHGYMDIEMKAKIDMLSIIIGGGISSRLFQTIREDLALCYCVGASNYAFSESGLFIVYLATDHDKESFAIDKSIEILNNFNFLEEELSRAKKQLLSSILMAYESGSYIAGSMAKFYCAYSRHVSKEELISLINNVNINHISKAAKNLFEEGNYSISKLGPKVEENI